MVKDSPFRAFIFDDEEDICIFLSEFLKLRGYEVFTFNHPGMCPNYNIESCGCPLRQACTDVIISDINMPISSGLDFVEKQIKKGCKCENIAIMSAYWNNDSLKRAINIGSKILQKPFSIEELIPWLEEVEKTISPTRKLSDWQAEGFFNT